MHQNHADIGAQIKAICADPTKLHAYIRTLDLTDALRQALIDDLVEDLAPDHNALAFDAIEALEPTPTQWVALLASPAWRVKTRVTIALHCVYEHSDALSEPEQRVIQTTLTDALASGQLTGTSLWDVIVELNDMRPWRIDIPAHRWVKAVGTGWFETASMVELARGGFEPLIAGLVEDYAFDQVQDEDEICAALQYFSPQTILEYVEPARLHEDTNYQHAALCILCCRMSPSFGPLLVEAFHRTPEMAFMLAWGLQEIQCGVPESKAVLLEHHVKELQSYVDGNHDLTYPIEDIGQIRTPEAIPHLLPYLHDERPQYHVATMRALSKLHDPTLTPHYVECITNDEYYECNRYHDLAAYGLAQIDHPDHTQWLLAQLTPPDDRPFAFEDHQFAFIEALQERLDIQACQPLAMMLLGQNNLGNLTMTLQSTLAMYGARGWPLVVDTLAALEQVDQPQTTKTQRNQRARGIWDALLTHQLIDTTTHTVARYATIYADVAQIMQPRATPQTQPQPMLSSKAAEAIVAKTRAAFELGDDGLYQQCCEEIATHRITQASDLLVEHLEHADDEQRLTIIEPLGVIGAVGAIPTLESIFERMPVYVDEALKFCAARALMAIAPNNTASHDFLLYMLREQYWGDRCDAAKLLMRSTAPIDDQHMRILTALSDEQDLDAMLDILALSAHTCSNTVQIELVESESWRCREQAAKNIAAAPSQDPLIARRLMMAFQTERHPLVRRAIAQALGAHHVPYPTATIAQAITNDPDPQVRQALAQMSQPA